MKIFRRITELSNTLFASIRNIISGEPTTERQRLAALLLALRKMQIIVDDIVYERETLRKKVEAGEKINRRAYRFTTNPDHMIARLLLCLNKVSILTASLNHELEPQNQALGEECASTLEAIARNKNLQRLAITLGRLRERLGPDGNSDKIIQLEEKLSGLTGLPRQRLMSASAA